MEDIKYWLALKRVEGVGDITFRNLVNRFGDPRSVFDANRSSLLEVEGIGEKVANGIMNFSEWDKVDAEIARLAKSDTDLLFYTDSEYPYNLSQIYNPPPFLYRRGDNTPDDINAVAIVGSRIVDSYGINATEKIAEGLANMGVTVVSGMARGVDSIAHRAALNAGGRTIAVLGSGIDVIYPPENMRLYEEITRNGAVLSEFPLGVHPDPANFPRRNRIISGLSLGVVVVRASGKSGALITASFALEQNRELFAVPGNVYDKLSKGTNYLIKAGAKLVENVDDILIEIEALKRRVSGGDTNERYVKPELTPDEDAVYVALEKEPMMIDAITKAMGFDTPKTLTVLLELELKGVVNPLPGKMFEIKR